MSCALFLSVFIDMQRRSMCNTEKRKMQTSLKRVPVIIKDISGTLHKHSPKDCISLTAMAAPTVR